MKRKIVKKSRKGGARPNAGRKKIVDNQKKIAVSIYVKKSDIDIMGGMDELKKQLHGYIEFVVPTQVS